MYGSVACLCCVRRSCCCCMCLLLCHCLELCVTQFRVTHSLKIFKIHIKNYVKTAPTLARSNSVLPDDSDYSETFGAVFMSILMYI